MKTLNILASILFAFAASVAMADTCLPLATKGEIPTPSVLADRIEESLKADDSGKGDIRGANTTPNGFLEAIKAAEGTVDSVTDLPVYLRNLVSGDMPKEMVQLSRVCDKKLDLKMGNSRTARPGEVGWYEVNTNKFILAGDCSNAHILPVQGTVTDPQVIAPQPPAKPVESYGAWGESRPLPTFTKPGTCPMIITPRIYTNAAKQVAGVAEQLGDENGGRRIEGAKDGSFDGDGSEATRVSRGLGLAVRGGSSLSSSTDTIIVEQIRGEFPHPGERAKNARVIFTGDVTGTATVPLPQDFDVTTDKLLVTPASPDDFKSPSKFSALRIWGKELMECDKNTFTMIKI